MELTKKEKSIFNWLKNDLQLSVYAEVYKGAVKLLKNKIPGYITFVAHASRDLINGLPHTVKGIKRQQVQYKNQLDDIEKQWEMEKLNKKSEEISYRSPSKDQKIEIPYKLYCQINKLIEEHRKSCVRGKKSDELFFIAFLDYKDEENISQKFLKEWKEAKDYFMKYTHLRKGSFDQDMSSKIKKHFETLSEFLYIAATGEYKRKMENINDILEKTNKRDDR